MCFKLHALWLCGRIYYFSEHCPAAQWILTNSIWLAMKSMLGVSLGPNAKPFCDEVQNHSLLEHVYKQADEVLKVPCGMSSPPPVEEAGQLKLGSHCLLLIVRLIIDTLSINYLLDLILDHTNLLRSPKLSFIKIQSPETRKQRGTK